MLYAAVVIPIVKYDDPALLFVKRAAHLRRNPGQIAFPGGIVDPDDADERAAALREFEEELGIARERVHLIDRLEDVVTLALSVTGTPFVGILEPPLELAADASETEDVYEVPLRAVYAPSAVHRGTERVVRDGTTYDVPSWLFDYENIHVWGATARMLHGLVMRYPAASALGALA
ncbi:MAG: CoA pyrophosphatase [Candidatus Eremiobacteraeota bacterium]|nr:CoA pyrophosphatase [Candidatus Eremiobacteraeota bacterium]